MAIITAGELAIQNGWNDLWIESDSTAAVIAFNDDKLPWQLKSRWYSCKRGIQKLAISSVWREANLVADQAAKKGLTLVMNQPIMYFGKPEWIVKWETPYGVYHRVR
ncbi:hypothetical protein ACHQM5_017300 [Ranunculus cassubicifolius]